MSTTSLWRPRWARHVAAAAGLVLLLGMVAAPQGATSVAAAPDDFYIPPATLPDGAPGDIVRSQAAVAGPSTSQEIANAWTVMYRSTDALKQPVAMTGTVLVPKDVDPATAPLVGFAPGTQGVSFDCAPSKMIERGAFYEQAIVKEMLEAGYAVAIPDYEGYHPQPRATYMNGLSMGSALLDVVRAAQRLPEAGLSDDAPVVLRGYSQGGGASMWAGQLQPTYAPEMKLRGVVGGGVPANLSLVALPLNGKAGFGLMAIALIGLDNAYPELNLESYLNDAGKQAFAAMSGGDCAFDLLTKYAGKTLADYTTTNPLSKADWLTRVSENTLGSTKIEVPVFQFHGTTDGLVAFGQADSLHQQYCGKGVKLQWKTYDTSSLGDTAASHISPISWSNEDSLTFIADRLAGEPAPTNC
jgi:dienelactone hydrolase